MGKDLERSIEEKIRRIKAYLDGVLSPEEEAEFSYWIDSSPKNKALLDRVRDGRVLLEKIRFRERSDLERGWHGIQKKMRKRPRLFVRLMRYAAVLVVVVLMGLIVFSVWDDGKGDDLKLSVQNETLSAKGGYKAYLELTNGKRLKLDSLSKLETRVEGAVIKAEYQGTVIVHEQQGDSLVEGVEYNRMIIPRGGEYKIVLADGSQVWINSQSVLEFPSRFTGGERRVKLKGEAYFEVSRDE
ncbi:MAG: FecR domain-containing protein, partial [Butyricimonas faecihominis]